MATQFVIAMAKMQIEMDETKANIKEAIESSISIFDEFDAKTELTGEQLLKNMQSQLNGISTWASNLDTLAQRGIDQGLLQHLAEMGPEGYEYVNAFMQLTGDELAKAGDMYEQSLTISDTTSERIMQSFQKAGMYSVEGLVQGIIENQEPAKKAAAELFNATEQGFNEQARINSPSTVMAKK